MGKGDQRSRRGKIWRGTFGKRRPKKSEHAVKATPGPVEAVTKPVRKKAAAAIKAEAVGSSKTEASPPTKTEAEVPSNAEAAASSKAEAVPPNKVDAAAQSDAEVVAPSNEEATAGVDNSAPDSPTT
jgi:30S ribosomal protein S31